jgi:hypothetical protein
VTDIEGNAGTNRHRPELVEDVDASIRTLAATMAAGTDASTFES